MNLTQFLSILRARWIVAVSVLAVAVLTAALVSLFVLTPRYSAQASVLVDVKPDPIAGMLFPGKSTAAVATQMDIIRSQRVAQRVIRNLRLTENPQTRQAWLESTGGQGSIEQWLVESFAASLEVIPSTESTVITVRYSSLQPQAAAQIANGFVDAFLQTALELRVNPARQYSTFFERQLKEARDSLEKAQARYSAFQREKGLIASDERLDIESQRLNELTSQLVALQAVAAESGSRQAQVGASGDRMQEVLSNPVLINLKAEIARADARLNELLARYGDRHPQVLEARASVAELRTELEAETRRVTGSIGVTANINRQREREVRASLDSQRARVLQLKSVRDDASVLLRDLENAQRTYDTVFAKFNQIGLESETTQTNVVKLTEAVAPVRPASPNVPLNIALSVVLGLMLALGTVLLLELMDRRVRTFDDISQGLGVPVLGTMPKAGARGRGDRAQALKMEQAVLGHSPLAGKGA
jgi:chain length determinant protein EpsF